MKTQPSSTIPVCLIDTSGNPMTWTYHLDENNSIVETGKFGELVSETNTAVIGNVNLTGDDWRKMEDNDCVENDNLGRNISEDPDDLLISVFSTIYFAHKIKQALSSATFIKTDGSHTFYRINHVDQQLIEKAISPYVKMILDSDDSNEDGDIIHKPCVFTIDENTSEEINFSFDELIYAHNKNNLSFLQLTPLVI